MIVAREQDESWLICHQLGQELDERGQVPHDPPLAPLAWVRVWAKVMVRVRVRVKVRARVRARVNARVRARVRARVNARVRVPRRQAAVSRILPDLI